MDEERELTGAIGDKYYICFEKLVCESVYIPCIND